MPISTGHRKQKTNAMKAYRKQRQYIYRHCQLCRVTPSYALIVGVCILMLPMLELATEHAQLTTMYYRNPINHVHARHMTFGHKPLMLPSLNNVLPAIAFENRIAWSNIGYQSTHSRVCHVTLSLVSTVPTGLARRVVRVVVLLLLLMSGDIETNPGPVGEWISLMYKAYKKLKYSYHLMKVYMVTYKGKSLGLCLAVLKIQSRKFYIESLPLVPKDKRSCFSEGERSAVQLPLCHMFALRKFKTLN